MNRPAILLLMLMALSLLCVSAAACGGGDDEGATPTVAPTAVPTIGPSDLPDLVLPDDSVTIDGTVLHLDSGDTRAKTRDEILEDGFDREWQEAGLDTYHWQATYYQEYGTGRERPVFNASVELDLYGTPADATGALADRFEHVLTWEGQTFQGVTIESVEVFEIEGFDGRGLRMKFAQEGGAAYLTNIDFVYGSILVDVGTASVDQRDLVAATRDLVARVKAHLSGQGEA